MISYISPALDFDQQMFGIVGGFAISASLDTSSDLIGRLCIQISSEVYPALRITV